MNWIAVVIIAAIFGELLISALADYLNIKSMRPELPSEFDGWYDPERYRLAQQYQMVNIRFSWTAGLVHCALVLLVWFGGGFALLDDWVRSWGLSPVLSGLLFIGSLGLLASAVSLPFRLYHTFVIEERFGFNRTTWMTFISDQAKGFILAVVLGTPLVGGILALFGYAGSFAWLYCWLAVTLYMLFVQFIAPVWIMPLFNKFTPLESEELRRAHLVGQDSHQFGRGVMFHQGVK